MISIVPEKPHWGGAIKYVCMHACMYVCITALRLAWIQRLFHHKERTKNCPRLLSRNKWSSELS